MILKQLAKELVDAMPKRGIGRNLQSSPKLILLAEAYLSGLGQGGRGLVRLSSALGISPPVIYSFYNSCEKIISPQRVTEMIREDRDYFRQTRDFGTYIGDCANQRMEARHAN